MLEGKDRESVATTVRAVLQLTTVADQVDPDGDVSASGRQDKSLGPQRSKRLRKLTSFRVLVPFDINGAREELESSFRRGDRDR